MKLLGLTNSPMSQTVTIADHQTRQTGKVLYLNKKYYSFPNATTCPYTLRGHHSWFWPKHNRLLRLGHPRVGVALSRECE
jgi:hypothetical protein